MLPLRLCDFSYIKKYKYKACLGIHLFALYKIIKWQKSQWWDWVSFNFEW